MRSLTLSLCAAALVACAAAPPDADDTAPPPDAPTSQAALVTGTELGERAPDFTLPRSDGGSVTLSQHRDGAVVLVFFRGTW